MSLNIFFIFAALAGLALIGSLSPEGKKQTTTAATEIENRAFTAPMALLNFFHRFTPERTCLDATLQGEL